MLFRRETRSCLDTVLCSGKLLWDSVRLVACAELCASNDASQARSYPYLSQAMQSACHAAGLGGLSIRTLGAHTGQLQPPSQLLQGAATAPFSSLPQWC